MSNAIKVGVVQHPCSQNKAENLERSITGIQSAADQGAKLVLLPELHTLLYFCQTEEPRFFGLAETIPGPTTQQLGGLAREPGIVLVGSLFEKSADGIYHNTAVVLDRDGNLAGFTGKCIYPMTRVITRNSISPLEIPASSQSKPQLECWV